MYKYIYITVEILGLEPKLTTCKIAALPIKLYPLIIYIYIYIITSYYIENVSHNITYPKNDLNVYDFISINLKIILSTNSSTRTYKT